LEKVFQRFYRVTDQNKSIRGTGLGLFICRQIIQAHQGEIVADSVVGTGTTFSIYLPLEDRMKTT
ncbi:MAG: ATP-binding protein, partial [Anaerolineales bacterium]|nr:ATP-binding protein [Anaerolineales bacterium]